MAPIPPYQVAFPASSGGATMPCGSAFEVISARTYRKSAPTTLADVTVSPCYYTISVDPEVRAHSSGSVSAKDASGPTQFVMSTATYTFSVHLSPAAVFVPCPVHQTVTVPVYPTPMDGVASFSVSRAFGVSVQFHCVAIRWVFRDRATLRFLYRDSVLLVYWYCNGGGPCRFVHYCAGREVPT